MSADTTTDSSPIVTACMLLGSEPRRQRYQADMLLDCARVYKAGDIVYSTTRGPHDSFQFRLTAYPAGDGANVNYLSTYIQIVLPEHFEGAQWTLDEVNYEIAVEYTCTGERQTVDRKGCASFRDDSANWGWQKMVDLSKIRQDDNWRNNKVLLRGAAWLPHYTRAVELEPLNLQLQSEPAFVALLLGDGSTLCCDGRVLTQRCHYFARMFAEPSWQEGASKEVDLRSDVNADRCSVEAVLHFLMTGQVAANDDANQMLMLRCLADQFLLPQMVSLVEERLSALVSTENVLTILGHVVGSGSRLEALCEDVLTAHACAVLDNHKDSFEQIMESKPDLALKLMHLLLKTAREVKH